jgi:hypothetical protein
MNTSYLKAFVGRGVKVHIGYEFEIREGRKILMVKCGSRSAGMAIHTYGELDLATYADNRNHCERCLERVKAKVGA